MRPGPEPFPREEKKVRALVAEPMVATNLYYQAARIHREQMGDEEKALEALRGAGDPDLLIVPALNDYHQHHRAAAELALNASNNAMQTTARLPTMPPSNGALTRNPLPMIEASGVTVAFQVDDVAKRFEKAR